MSPLWQNIAIILILAAASAYLILRLIKRRQNRKGCAGCQIMKSVSAPGVKSHVDSGGN